MKDILGQLATGTPLTAKQAEAAFGRIMKGDVEPAQVGAILALLAVREPTVEELVGVAQVMREHVVRIPAPAEVIDTCGTGGVGSTIFNVSTTAAIVAAACGVPVAKHGNRSVTSRSGSSEVLKLLGVNIEAGPEVQARCLAEAGICFAFAPKHHPAMKHVAPVRQALGFATIFNLVGPLTNPAGARRQLVGVRSPELANKVLAVLVDLGAQRAMVVNGTARDTVLCELSVSGPTYVVAFDGAKAYKYTVTPTEVGLREHPLSALEIDSPEASAAVVRKVLSGESGAARDMVLMNAAGALWVAGKAGDLAEGVKLAAGAVDGGAALGTLERLVRVSNA